MIKSLLGIMGVFKNLLFTRDDVVSQRLKFGVLGVQNCPVFLTFPYPEPVPKNFQSSEAKSSKLQPINLKLFDRYATYCYLQVDLKSFLASGTFFLGRDATERATISQVINSRHS